MQVPFLQPIFSINRTAAPNVIAVYLPVAGGGLCSAGAEGAVTLKGLENILPTRFEQLRQVRVSGGDDVHLHVSSARDVIYSEAAPVVRCNAVGTRHLIIGT